MIIKKCILCGSEKNRFILKGYDRYMEVDKKEYKIQQCLECELTSLNPTPNENELLNYYPFNYKVFIERKKISGEIRSNLINKFKDIMVHKFKLNHLKNTLDKFSDKSINYLDYGCGSGKNIFSLKEKFKNWKFFGYDKYNSKLSIKNNDSIIFFQDLEKLDKLGDNYFHIINLSSVIEHVQDPISLIIFLKKKLCDGGIIIIKTPNFNSLSRKFFGKYWHNLDIPRHLHIFSDENLIKMLNDNGLKKKKIFYSRNSGVEVKSLYSFFDIKKKPKIHNFIISLFNPLTLILSLLKTSSTITIVAQKS